MTFESKFRNFVGRIEKLSKEETIIIARDLLNQLNKEKKIKEREIYIENDDLSPNENWDDINSQVKRSHIKRYKWDKILGESLTKRILKLRNKETSAKETIKIISNLKGIKYFLQEHPREEKNLMKNLRINVHARYGENKTSENLKNENNN